jgi:glycosyltransferase involved in cell wall biosynthesis
VTTGAAPIRRVVVGIPARDEAAMIAACLASIAEAARRAPPPVHVVVADDGSADGTAALARSAHSGTGDMSLRVVTGRFGSAGAARAAALDAGITAVGGDLTTVWLATTDADSVVAADWLACHLRWASTGVDAVAGLVDVAWRPDQQVLAHRYSRARARGGTATGHHHVHGANLGVRASRWAEVGGCGDGEDGEDGELWRRLRAAGVAPLGVTDLRVLTSARLRGRAPRGFSGFLRAMDRDPGAADRCVPAMSSSPCERRNG